MELLDRAETSTGWVELLGVFGSDEMIAQVARTSYGPSGRAVRDNAGLVRYLVEHGHTGPLEFAQTWWRVQAPIYVARQWLRHRTASVNEHSLRYAEPLGAGPCADPISWQGLGPDASDALAERMALAYSDARDNYEAAEIMGARRESARAFLPLAEPTRWMWRIDLHNLLHFLGLRQALGAQPEIQEYARAMERMIAPRFPAVVEAWRCFRRDALTLAADEIALVGAYLQHGPSADLSTQIDALGARRAEELRAKILRLQRPDLCDLRGACGILGLDSTSARLAIDGADLPHLEYRALRVEEVEALRGLPVATPDRDP